MHSILSDLELVQPGGKGVSPAVHFFDSSLDTWVKMKVDSVIELTKPSQKLFFKGVNITLYPHFNHHFGAALVHEANPYVSLSQERTYVRQTQTNKKAHALDTLDALLELSSDEDSNNPPPAPSPQKCHTQSTQPLPRSQKLRCDSGTCWLVSE